MQEPGTEETLTKLIHEEIGRRGPMRFSRFMELALYHPQFGYYRSNRNVFGPNGDYYTAEQLQPVFGELMRLFIAQLAQRPDSPTHFQVVEVGAGRADLAAPLAEWNYLGFDVQSQVWPDKIRGLVLAHEFFDALPFDILEPTGNGWLERKATVGKTEPFVLTECAIEDNHPAAEYLARLRNRVEPGWQIEWSPHLEPWMQRIAGSLRDGYLLVIDYGYVERELVRFPEGTAIAFKEHQTSADLLRRPGEQDITAHVNFDLLARVAKTSGLALESSMTLSQWIMALRSEEGLGKWWEKSDWNARLKWKQLVFGMGETFRVLLFRSHSTNKSASETSEAL